MKTNPNKQQIIEWRKKQKYQCNYCNYAGNKKSFWGKHANRHKLNNNNNNNNQNNKLNVDDDDEFDEFDDEGDEDDNNNNNNHLEYLVNQIITFQDNDEVCRGIVSEKFQDNECRLVVVPFWNKEMILDHTTNKHFVQSKVNDNEFCLVPEDATTIDMVNITAKLDYVEWNYYFMNNNLMEKKSHHLDDLLNKAKSSNLKERSSNNNNTEDNNNDNLSFILYSDNYDDKTSNYGGSRKEMLLNMLGSVESLYKLGVTSLHSLRYLNDDDFKRYHMTFNQIKLMHDIKKEFNLYDSDIDDNGN